MPLAELQRLLREAADWTAGVGKSASRLVCLNCNASFYGRTNRLYCGRKCKKDAANARAKIDQLIMRIAHSTHAEREALSESNYHDVRYIRARRSRDVTDLNSMLDQNVLKADPEVMQRVATLISNLKEAVSDER